MEALAIVGYAFRLPQGTEDDLSFWEVLSNHRNLMTEWPEARTNIDGFFDGGSRRAGTVCSHLKVFLFL
jgi:acyl transferase domain-containing protein